MIFNKLKIIFTELNQERIGEDNLRRLSLIPSKKFNKILDAGCEDGFLSRKIKEMTGAEVYGVDIILDNCKSASKKGIIVKQADLNKEIPFPDGFFDLIFAGEIVEHLYNPDRFLGEAGRVLKDDGFLILTTPNLSCLYNRILLFFGIQPLGTEASAENARVGFGFIKELKTPKSVGHLRVFTLRAIKELLKLYGFKIEQIKGSPITSFPNPIYTFEKFISFFPSLSFHIMIRAKK